MTFLNPFVLFGLVAASIPLLLHLLNLRKLQTIDFSSLTFLKELQQTKIRRLKLRQLLLLIIRTLLIIFIVLAFARPAIRGTILGSIGSHANSTVIIILDDSFTMAAGDEHGDRFKQAKDAALRIIDLLKEGDEACLLRLSDVPKATVDPAAHDFSLLRNVVNESRISPVHRTFGDAIRLSAKLLERSHNANKEVYIITDMQATQFLAESKSDSSVRLFNERVSVFLMRIGSKPVPNVAIDSVSLTTAIFEKGKPIGLYTSIRNFSDVPLSNYVVSVYLDGVHAAQRNLSVEAWGSASLEIEATPKHTGFTQGYVEIENDLLEPDNRRYFTVSIPDNINVAIISSTPGDNQFLRTAIDASGQESGHGLFTVQNVTTQKLSRLDLKNLDVVICQGETDIENFEAQRLANFVQGGGGLIIFPSSAAQPGSTNSFLLSELKIPGIQGFTNGGTGNGVLFQHVDVDHPLFTHMFENDQSGTGQRSRQIESPNIYKLLRHGTTKTERTVISLNNGSPFLSEYTHGEGKILFYSVAPVLSWSDFPLKGIFAPLLYRSILYTANRGESVPSYICGDEPAIILSQVTQAPPAAQVTMVDPDGTEEIVAASQNISGSSTRPVITLASKRLADPGFYMVKNNSLLLGSFAVNIDPHESDPRMISRNDADKFFHRFGIPASSIISVEPGQQIQTTVLQSRFGVELWRYCIGLALLLALIEMLIARDSRKATQEIS
jgi:hypothetical protein